MPHTHWTVREANWLRVTAMTGLCAFTLLAGGRVLHADTSVAGPFAGVPESDLAVYLENRYAVWNQDGVLQFSKSADRGETWDAPLVLATNVHGDGAIACDGNGDIYVAYARDGRYVGEIAGQRRYLYDDCKIYCKRSLDGGSEFSDDVLVVDDPYIQPSPDIAVRSGRIYVTASSAQHVNNWTAIGKVWVFRAQSADCSFGPDRKALVISDDGVYWRHIRPRIAASDSGQHVHIVWNGDFPNLHTIQTSRSEDFGETFLPMRRLSSGYGGYYHSVAASGEDAVFISCMSDFGQSTGTLYLFMSTDSGSNYVGRALDTAYVRGGRTTLASKGDSVLLAWDILTGATTNEGIKCVWSGDRGETISSIHTYNTDGCFPCAGLTAAGIGHLTYVLTCDLNHWLCSSEGVAAGISDLTARPGLERGDVKLSWTTPDSEVNVHDIRYSTNRIDAASFVEAARVPDPPDPLDPSEYVDGFVVSGLTPGATYYFMMRTDNVFTELSNPAESVSCKEDTTPPGRIDDLHVDLSVFLPYLVWTASGDNGEQTDLSTPPDGRYVVKHSSVPITTEEEFSSATEYVQAWSPKPVGQLERHRIEGLTPSHRYFFAVRAFDEMGHGGDLSNSVELDHEKPVVSVVAESGSEVRLEWAPLNSKIPVYQYRITRNGRPVGVVWPKPRMIYKDKALDKDTQYQYEIVACGPGGQELDRTSPLAVRTHRFPLQFGWSEVEPIAGDYDGDGADDVAVHHPPTGTWYLSQSRDGFRTQQFGWFATKPVSGDFDGDGTNDLAVYHPEGGMWYMLLSGGGVRTRSFGWSAAEPVPADYDGDGTTDLAVYHPEAGVWYVTQSSNGFKTQQFGWWATRPVRGDFDGDGTDDIAVYHPDTGTWYVLTAIGVFSSRPFGWSGAEPVPADYDGDGKTDYGVFHAPTCDWYTLTAEGAFHTKHGDVSGAMPVPADYNGDKVDDRVLFWPPDGSWRMLTD